MRWRLRSRLCAALDVIAVLEGAGLFVLAAVDSVSSWPADTVLITDPQLARVADGAAARMAVDDRLHRDDLRSRAA